MEIRLQKWLADAGAASRRKAEEMIAEGRVAVNGQTVTTLGAKADPGKDTVTLDGKPLKPENEPVYILLHKPEGVITSVSDPQGRPVVTNYVPQTGARLYPVGRLDYDSSGLLLMTNDGALAQALTHPKHAIEKKYAAKISGVPSGEALQKFRTGIVIDGKRTAPCEIRKVRVMKPGPDARQTLVNITLREGRNRQIRKMCEAIGHPVLFLKRVAIGPVKLGDLPRGAWRYLTAGELAALRSAAGIKSTPGT